MEGRGREHGNPGLNKDIHKYLWSSYYVQSLLLGTWDEKETKKTISRHHNMHVAMSERMLSNLGMQLHILLRKYKVPRSSSLPEPSPACQTLQVLAVLSLLPSQPLSALMRLPQTFTLPCLSAGGPQFSQSHLHHVILEGGPEFKIQIRIPCTSLFVI